MRAARVFRWIMRIIILLLTLSLSVVTILGGLSAVNILSDSDNIQVPPSGYSISNNISTEPDNSSWYVNVPIGINNVGYFDLNNLEIDFSLYMEYTSTIDSNRHNTTLFSEIHNFGNLPSGDSGVFQYNATGFTVPLASEVQISPSPLFWANVTVSAYYSLDLIQFEIHIVDLSIT